MPTFEIIPAKSWHCGQMVRLMHHEDTPAILTMGLGKAHVEMRQCFDSSMMRRAWLIDGSIAALGGVVASRMSVQGYVWLAISNRARRYPIAFAKECKRQLADVTITFRDLYAAIANHDAEDQKRDAKFARFMGFGLSPTKIAVDAIWHDTLTFRYREAA